MTQTLVVGGARSGKSSRAESLAADWPVSRIYLATLRSDLCDDDEMQDRVARHQEQRGPNWITRECGGDLPGMIEDLEAPALVDCLTVWLGGVFADGGDPDAAIRSLARSITRATHDLILVSNEIGMGLVPPSPEGRAFRDAQGRLNQQVAAVCDRVEFVAAGLPLVMKDNA